MKQEELNPVRVRLQPELRVALRRAAQSMGRSVNSLTVELLTQGLRLRGITIRRAKGNAPRARTLRASV